MISVQKDSQGLDKFEINEDASSILEEIDTDIAIFSMCGAAHCGKSFLLNCILEAFEGNGVSRYLLL